MQSQLKCALTLSVMALVSISSLSQAQRGGGGGGGRGGRGGQRNDGESNNNSSQDVGVTGAPPMPLPVAALAIEHAAELKLTDAQSTALATIRHSQDSTNAPLLRVLDSLRPRSRPANGPDDLSAEQRQVIDERRAAITPVLEAVRETNAEARIKVMALLDPDQQKRAAEFEEEARKKVEAEGKRLGRGVPGDNGMGRKRGGGGGRPLED
jgi:Spy/CpxP family protein refolding chaperone